MAKTRLKIGDVRNVLGQLGLTIRRQQGEYRVAYKGVEYIRRYGAGGSPEDSAYYTTDLSDALHTGLAMARHVNPARPAAKRRRSNPQYRRLVAWRSDAKRYGYKVRRSEVGDSLVAYVGKWGVFSATAKGQYDLVSRGGWLEAPEGSRKYNPRRMKKRNPVKISKPGRKGTPFQVWTKRAGQVKFYLAAKTYSLAKAISVAVRMARRGYGIQITGPREIAGLFK